MRQELSGAREGTHLRGALPMGRGVQLSKTGRLLIAERWYTLPTRVPSRSNRTDGRIAISSSTTIALSHAPHQPGDADVLVAPSVGYPQNRPDPGARDEGDRPA